LELISQPASQSVSQSYKITSNAMLVLQFLSTSSWNVLSFGKARWIIFYRNSDSI